jgi:hypothetical protein
MAGHPQRVALNATGFTEFIGERWNPETRAVAREAIDDPFPWLRVELTLEGDVTLGGVFRAVERFPALVDVLALYSWCAGLRAFHDEALRTPARAGEGRSSR